MLNLMCGDCLDMMKNIEDNSIDSIVTDAPYGLSFMGKAWDKNVPSTLVWEECYRVLKPGGYLLCFAGTRTQHRMACNIEDAGFEIKDMIAWIYGSGFPKSMDISKQIDKKNGVKPTDTGETKRTNSRKARQGDELVGAQSIESLKHVPITKPTSEEAKQWEGWGTALKPALEPITVARKPHKGTIANNVLLHGVGGLNIDACRVPAGTDYHDMNVTQGGDLRSGGIMGRTDQDRNTTFKPKDGRFPANLVHDGSDEVLAVFPAKAGACAKVKGSEQSKVHSNTYSQRDRVEGVFYGDKGSAARFFYCAKAAPSERHYGMPEGVKNDHPTVKPIALMQWLIKLVTPIGGLTFDPYMGSGTTGLAAIKEGVNFVGIELDNDYFTIAKARINALLADEVDHA
ncbi:DNA-methyltransferase [Photobacterium leiognathi]|uniref:DNA-methyltransferase n=1 Tax=Photobacterium leiognathi TaxID=553611 RepID=UPI0029816478|nr:site-specific DNA-methyltransferase [Photobacterium leiognathi]